MENATGSTGAGKVCRTIELEREMSNLIHEAARTGCIRMKL